MTGAIQKDAQTVDGGYSESDAAEAFLTTLIKEDPQEDEVSEEVKEPKKTNDAEDESDESEDTGEESPEDKDEDEGTEETDEKTVVEDDTAYVKVKVDGEDREVSVRDLKRLYGQEASLTRKSQEVSARRKEAEELGARYVAGLSGLLQKAQQKAQPYKNIDFLAAAQQLKPDELQALRQEALEAFENEKYLNEELGNFMTNLQNERRNSLIERGREAVKELKRDIPGWNEKVYNDIRHFAVSSGLDTDVVDNLVDASALKIIHKAMLYDRGKTSNTITKKKSGMPKKIIKTSKTGNATTKDLISDKTNAKKAMKKLEQSGSTDDAAEAFLARWQAASDDN